MIGAIIGDVAGSIYEWRNIKTTDFPLLSPACHFTDDSVMSIAVADALQHGTDISAAMRRYGNLYPYAGYGGRFRQWLNDSSMGDYGSFGNGSAMRASAAGWIAGSLEEAIEIGRQTAIPTHGHPEGVRGAQVVAGGVWLLRNGADRQQLRDWVTAQGYSLDFTLDEIRPTYRFDVTCQGSVPQAVVAFLEADDFESAIRKAISIGGDSDTIACIAGSLAEAYFPVPEELIVQVCAKLPPDLLNPLIAFEAQYATPLPL